MMIHTLPRRARHALARVLFWWTLPAPSRAITDERKRIEATRAKHGRTETHLRRLREMKSAQLRRELGMQQ